MAESKKITAAQAKEAARDPTSAGAKAIREKVLADMKKQKEKEAVALYQNSRAGRELNESKKLAEGRARYNAAQEKNPSKTVTAAQAKEAAQDPTSAGAKAIREKVFADMKAAQQAAYREAYNAPLARMSRNSTSWSMLGQAKDTAKKAKWPEKAVGKMTAKQDALHQANVEIAKPYDITFDAENGVWRGGDSYGEWKGAQVYDARKALPLPGSTASDMAMGARNVRDTAGRFQPNRAGSAAQAAENRAKSAQRAKDTLMWPVHQTMAAIGGVTGSFYDTANMALETTGIDKFLPDAVKNWVTKNAQLGHGVQEQVRAVNYERGGKLGGAAGDLAQLGVEMLGQYALAAATGGSTAGAQLGAKTGTVSKALETIAKSPNFWYSFVRTAGPEYEEAKANGASGPQAATAAILSALGQAGVEMGGGVETLAGTPAAGVKGAVKSMLEEGGEEAMQDLISGLAHKGVYDKGRGWLGSGDSGAVVNPQRMAGEFAMGALGASLPVGVNALMRRGKTYSLPLPQDSASMAGQTQTAKGLPLPQDSAKAGSNPAATNSQGLPLPTSFPETAKTQTVGLPTSFPETGTAKGLPTEISYEAQIDGVFNGRLPEHKNITVGPTPDILKKYGAKSRDMTITQPAVRKIAYPDGYMGGKHNLGISALKNLPKQLENPIAILKSKTQDGSVVILTEWNDTQDNPVIAAIHFDKQGALTLENRIASVYGKRNLEALLGRNNENVLYTKENKSIDQLLSERLQLPSTMADDTLVAYSIAQNEGKNKGNPQAGAEVKGQTQENAGAADEGYMKQLEGLRDELESDLAAARRVLPTPGSEARIRALQSGLEDINRELAALGQRRADTALPDSDVSRELAALGQRGADTALPDSDVTRALLDAWDAKRQAEQQAEETRKGLTLTRRDMEMAQAAARMGMDSQRWEQADNPEQAYIYGGALRDVREADRPIREFMAERQAALQGDAQQAAEWLAEFAKDKRTGFQYQRETMERNIRDIFGAGHRETADAIIREYITPVHKAVADGNRLKNDYRARVKALKLNQHESALVQMMLENETGAVNEYIANNHIQITPELDGKLQNAVQEFRAIYNELYTQINAALLLGGQEPAPFRKNYAPHFRKDKPDTMLGRIRFALGLGKDSSLNLPTDLAGITDEFRPGKKWFGNLLQREGEITDFDAVAGFDRYIETAADVITLTDSIQRLRALEDAVRYTLSDEGVRDQIDAIRANDELDALEQRKQMEEVYGDNPSTAQKLIADLRNQQQMGMGRFVSELRRYTDNLAGKKSREDRAMEDMLNRQIYTVAKNMEGRTAANMIALNPGSWLTNLIPITQASGEVSAGNLLAGMRDTVKAFVKDDGFADASDFLTNRTGADRLDKTITQRVGDAAGAGMEFFDRIASQTIVRARARQNMQSGMSFEEAIADADSFAAGLMADRSKGAQPTIFNATNPLTKTVTMFQIEVNNQLSYLFKDMPQAQAQKGAAAVAWAYTKVFAGAYLYNLVYKQLTGRDAAFDPIGWIMEAFGIGEDDEEERTGFDVAESLGKNVAENLPFVGGLLGGGRVPVSSAIPNPFTIWDAAKSDASREKKGQEIGKELLKPAAYLLPPFGGGAVKRAVEGAQAVRQGGVYGMDNKGNRMLKFPVYGQGAKDYAQAVLFGRYSLPTGREYIDSGFQGGLNAKNTAIYERLAQGGTDPQKAYEAIRAVTGTKAPEDGSLTGAQAKREAIMALDLTPEEKVELNRALVGGDDLVSFQDRDSFNITNTVAARNQPAAFALMREQGMDTAQAKKYAELVDEQGATYTLGKDQKITKTYEDGRQEERLLYTKDGKAARLKKAYETIQADESLTDGQKNGVVRAVVLSKLGKKYAGEYAEEFIGGIGVEQLIDAQAAYEDISEDVKKDTTIHENNRSEYVRLRFADYLENTGLDFLRRESLWYFQSHDESEFKEPWSEIIRKTTPSDEEERTRKQSALRGLQDSGMDESLFKVIKAGMGRVYADKDANGESIDGSRKRKLIEYLNQYDGLTDEQKNLLMKTDAYKYGMGEKPKKGKSSSRKYPLALPTSFKLPSMKSLLPF